MSQLILHNGYFTNVLVLSPWNIKLHLNASQYRVLQIVYLLTSTNTASDLTISFKLAVAVDKQPLWWIDLIIVQ